MDISSKLSLLSLSIFFLFFCLCHSCDEETQYSWEVQNHRKCCNKCQPGYRMINRCGPESQETDCTHCPTRYYLDSYNIERNCKLCSDCTMKYMVFIENCTSTRNSVCGCASGYRCRSTPCLDCEAVTPRTVATSTAKPRRPNITPEEIVSTPEVNHILKPPEVDGEQDKETLLLYLCLVCVCMCLLLIGVSSRCPLKKLGIIGLWAAKNATHHYGKAEEDVQTPIQEMCGKVESCENLYC